MGEKEVRDHQMLLRFFMVRDADEGSGRAGCDPLLDADQVGGPRGMAAAGTPFHGVGQWVGPHSLLQAKSDKMCFLCRNLEGWAE